MLFFVILNFVHKNEEHLFSFFSDIKRTQWEDPRLQNVAITGPVSLFVPVCSDGIVLSPISSRVNGQGYKPTCSESEAHLQFSLSPPLLQVLVILTLHNSFGKLVSQAVKMLRQWAAVLRLVLVIVYKGCWQFTAD